MRGLQAPAICYPERQQKGKKERVHYFVLAETTTRNPRLLFRLEGGFLSRLAERQFRGLLFQDPPRSTWTVFPLFPYDGQMASKGSKSVIASEGGRPGRSNLDLN